MAIIGARLYGNPDYEAGQANPSPKLPQGPQVLQPGHQETLVVTDGYPNDRLIKHDRHVFYATGTEKSARDSGLADPLGPGQAPARPSLRTINRTINHQVGTSNTRNDDDLSRRFNRTNNGHLFVGQQDGRMSPVYGGTPGLYEPYGSYGGYTTGSVKGIQSPAAVGSPQDGPQEVYAGPPHGLHTATFPDYSQTLGYYMSVPQMLRPTVSRPFNSKIDGQSYSQTVVPLGQAGTVAVTAQEGTPRTVGYQPGGAWRGQ